MVRKLREVEEEYKFSAPLIKVVPSIIHPTMHPEEDTNVKVVNTYKDISILVIAFVFFKHYTMCHYIYMLLKEIQAFALHNSFNNFQLLISPRLDENIYPLLKICLNIYPVLYSS